MTEAAPTALRELRRADEIQGDVPAPSGPDRLHDVMQQSDIAHHNGDVGAAILRGRSVALNDVRSQAGAGNPKTSPTSQRCDHDIRWKSVPHRLPARMKRAPGSGAPSNFLPLNASLWRTLQPLSDGRRDLVAARSHRRTKKPRARRG
jgi:hypothetical protein